MSVARGVSSVEQTMDTADRFEIAETFAVAVEEVLPEDYQPQPYLTLPNMEEEEFPYLLQTKKSKDTECAFP